MPHTPNETGPENQSEQPSTTPQEQPTQVDANQLATSIITGCASGTDVSEQFAAIAAIENGNIRSSVHEELARQLAESPALLTEPHHWMTLAKGAGRTEYIEILRRAHEQSEGLTKLTIGTKLADALRRESDQEKQEAALTDADTILRPAIHSIDDQPEHTQESLRALSSAYYTRSFVSFGRASLPGTGDEDKDGLIGSSLVDLKKSREYAERGGDQESAAQSENRYCAVLLDTGRGDPAELVGRFDQLVQGLAAASDTWGKRYLKNALSRRVEAAAKCNHVEWVRFYDTLMAQGDLEAHYGGSSALRVWMDKYCPPSRRAAEGLETSE